MTLLVNIYGFAKKTYIPLVVVLLLLLAFIAFEGYQLINLQTIQEQEQAILEFVTAHWFISPLLYIVVYIALVSISAPGAFIFSIIGGFVFGPVFGGFLAVIAASTGALIIYEIMHFAVGDDVENRLSPFAAEIRRGFMRYGFAYMVILRVAPVLPFWAVNLVPAFLGVDRRVNIITTVFGIMPSCLVYAFIGAGMASVIQRGHVLDMSSLMTDYAVLLPFNALVLLLALPLMVKLWCHYKEEKRLPSQD